MTEKLIARLEGNTCVCGDVVGHGHGGQTPVLDLCRKLTAAGVDPNASLDVYRGETVALQVQNIGYAAALAVWDHSRTGAPAFRRWYGAPWRPCADSSSDFEDVPARVVAEAV